MRIICAWLKLGEKKKKGGTKPTNLSLSALAKRLGGKIAFDGNKSLTGLVEHLILEEAKRIGLVAAEQ